MTELLHGAGAVCIYFVVAASTAFALRMTRKIPDEIFRKGLHFILLGAYIPFITAFETWYLAALFAVVLEILIYPILAWFEHFQNYSSITTERKKGEFKHSLLLAFTMLAVAIAVCWGWLGDKLLVLACMYAWGVGDAFAALIGKRFGRHKIRLKFADRRKSVEGSLAMFLSSALSVAAVLLIRGGLSWGGYVVIPVAAAAVTTLVEMHTRGGMDTVTCPTAALLVILPLAQLFEG